MGPGEGGGGQSPPKIVKHKVEGTLFNIFNKVNIFSTKIIYKSHMIYKSFR